MFYIATRTGWQSIIVTIKLQQLVYKSSLLSLYSIIVAIIFSGAFGWLSEPDRQIDREIPELALFLVRLSLNWSD